MSILVFLTERLAHLGYSWGGAVMLALDLTIVAVFAGAVGVLARWRTEVPPMRFLFSTLTVTGSTIAIGMVLGITGHLSSHGFLMAHAVIACAMVAIACHKHHSSVGQMLVTIVTQLRGDVAWLGPRPQDEVTDRRDALISRCARVALFGVLTFFLVTAVLAYPLNFDSNAYRLTRIGAWLQDGQLTWLETNDARTNYIAFHADLLMLWLTSFFESGFPFANCIQWLGGVIALAAIDALALGWGWRPLARATALLLFVGVAPVAVQFSNTQTDLVTTGFLTASLAVGFRALQRPQERGYWLAAGLLFGIAVGTKGTVFYWGPGLLLCGILWLWKLRPPLRPTCAGLLVCAAVALPFAAPTYVRNLVHIQNPFATKEHLAMFHADKSVPLLQRAYANFAAFTWQLFEPAANPGLNALTNPAYHAIDASLGRITAVPGKSFHVHRRLAKETFVLGKPHEDFVSCGVVFAVIGVFGIAAAFWSALRRRSDWHYTAGIAALLVVSLFFFAAMQTWTPHKFRYFTNLAPFLALLGVAPLAAERGPRWGSWVLGVASVWATFSALFFATMSANHGWLTMQNPSRSLCWGPHQRMASLVEAVGPSSGGIAVVQPENSFLGPLYRNPSGHRITQVGFEQYRRDKSNVVMLTRTKSAIALVYTRWDRGDRLGLESLTPREPLLENTALRLRSPEQPSRPWAAKTNGFYADGWSQERFFFTVDAWPLDLLEVTLQNHLPLERVVTLAYAPTRTNGELLEWCATDHPQHKLVHFQKVTIAPNSVVRVSLEIDGHLVCRGEVTPLYRPEVSGRGDARALGIQVQLPNLQGPFLSGRYSDDWCAPVFHLELPTNGRLALICENLAALPRQLQISGLPETLHRDFLPTQSMRIDLEGVPGTVLRGEITPTFVPSEHGPSKDNRNLGMRIRLVADENPAR